MWEEIGKGFSILESHEDIGYKLKLVAAPKLYDGSKLGPSIEVIAKNEIQAGPGFCPLLEIGFSMILVHGIINEFKVKSLQEDISLIFCGDFNSVPECGFSNL